jgi:polyisoprenoid-binding protein YceI
MLRHRAISQAVRGAYSKSMPLPYEELDMCETVSQLRVPNFSQRWSSICVLSCLLVAAFAARAEPSQYEIDPDHVTVSLLVEHLGYAKVLGLFREVSGSYRFDEQTGELSDVSVVVNTDSIFTNHERRDGHLRSKDFLNTRRFPDMTFTAMTAQRTGEKTFEIEGSLELLGVTRPLILSASWNKSAEYPIDKKQYVMGVSARGSLQRSEHGMNYGVENGWVGDRVEIIIEFEARRR